MYKRQAQTIVRASYREPLYHYESNVIGTANVLEALKTLDKKCAVVIITTDKVYENLEIDKPYKEDAQLGGYDPYSASKACADIATHSYMRSFFNLKDYEAHQKSICIVRAGNVIGGGDWTEDALIPDLMRSLSRGETLILRNPLAVRPWQHVLEALSAYLLLGEKLYNDPFNTSGAWNVGPRQEDILSVKALIKIAISIWGSGEYEISSNKSDWHEAQLLRLDIGKIKNKLNWHPTLTANEAIEQTITWYQKFLLEKQDARKLVLSDIASFSKSYVSKSLVKIH